jgi:hypothetical protein
VSAVVAIFVTILATAAFIVLLSRLEEGYWPPVGRWVRSWTWVRRLTGCCVACGHRRERHTTCLHCASADYYGWTTCHACSKQLNFAQLYGASPELAARIQEREEKAHSDGPACFNYLIQQRAAHYMMERLHKDGLTPEELMDAVLEDLKKGKKS